MLDVDEKLLKILGEEQSASEGGEDEKELVYKAKVTPRQKQILYRRFLDGYSNVMVSMEMNIAVETVRNELRASYEQIYHALYEA